MKVFILCSIITLMAGVMAGCGNGDSAANDINRLFDDVMPDGLEMTTENSTTDYSDDSYGMYGGYGNYNDGYDYNNNYNNVYGTAPGDFNRAGYNSDGKGNIDFDITPSNFASEENTQVETTSADKK